VLDNELSFTETVDNITAYDSRLLTGKGNIESYLKTICYHADEELMHGRYGERAKLRDDIYSMFAKTKFKDEPWWKDVDNWIKGKQLLEPNALDETIKKAIEYYPIVINDDLPRTASRIKRFLEGNSVEVPEIKTNEEELDLVTFQKFISESTRAFNRTGNIDWVIHKYGDKSSKDFYKLLRKFEESLLNEILV
jgi:adenylate kinase family enzyme